MKIQNRSNYWKKMQKNKGKEHVWKQATNHKGEKMDRQEVKQTKNRELK